MGIKDSSVSIRIKALLKTGCAGIFLVWTFYVDTQAYIWIYIFFFLFLFILVTAFSEMHDLQGTSLLGEEPACFF